MPCYHPLTAYHTTGGAITFDISKSFGKKFSLNLPCGRCLGCRLEKSKEWALRCHHESLMHDENCFITLTYRDADLPENGNLQRIDFQKFIRSLRKKTKRKIRYFMCGEYGDKTNRPHYHAILFGYSFPDQKFLTERRGNRVYTSAMLEKTWKLGICELGSVSYKSSGYVARYILKKQTGDPADVFERYVIIDTETGEMSARHNEYTNMSLKPGIGESWYAKFKGDLFPHDYAITPDGRQTQVPTYYRTLLEREDPELHSLLRKARIEKAKLDPNNTPERLNVREICHKSKTKPLKRDFL